MALSAHNEYASLCPVLRRYDPKQVELCLPNHQIKKIILNVGALFFSDKLGNWDSNLFQDNTVVLMSRLGYTYCYELISAYKVFFQS